MTVKNCGSVEVVKMAEKESNISIDSVHGSFDTYCDVHPSERGDFELSVSTNASIYGVVSNSGTEDLVATLSAQVGDESVKKSVTVVAGDSKQFSFDVPVSEGEVVVDVSVESATPA